MGLYAKSSMFRFVCLKTQIIYNLIKDIGEEPFAVNLLNNS